MAHRIRNQQQQQQQQQHSNRTADAANSSNKRKRDVLQDISEEHSGNGAASRQHQHQHVTASASASRRAQQAPRRPSPMAPARRASVRRSRRLSEQQPSSAGRTGGRGGRTVATAAAGGDNGSAGGGGGERGTGGDSDAEGYEGGMSCDEDLEGMVVDLSFEGVADDSVWREREKQPGSAGSHPANSGDGTGGNGAGTEGGGGSEAESSSSSSGSSGNGQVSNAKPDVSERRVGRLRDRSGMAASGGRGRQASDGSVSNTTLVREAGSAGGRDSRVLRGGSAAGEKNGARRGRRESLEIEAGANFPCAVSGGHSVDLQTACTPDAKSKASPAYEPERNASSAAAGARTPLPAGVDDIDSGVWEEGDSHLRNPDYVVEHAAFLRVQEKRNRPAAYIGARQKDMRQSMRSVLVDWIVEVCDQFKLSSRTLFQVVDLIDRSLTAFEVPRGKLQLLGCACVVLASKYEEIYAPTAEELAHISDNTYTRAEIISMELVVVNALQFRLSCITPCNFVDRFCRAARSNAREGSLVAYLLELQLQDYQGVTLLPSLKAAAALYLARQTLHPRGCPRESWSKQTEYYTGYGARALESCVRRLHSLHLRAEANNLHAVRDKYKKSALHRVAEVTCALEDALHFGDP